MRHFEIKGRSLSNRVRDREGVGVYSDKKKRVRNTADDIPFREGYKGISSQSSSYGWLFLR